MSETIAVPKVFLQSILEYVEGVQDRAWDNAELSERANVLEFKLAAVLKLPDINANGMSIICRTPEAVYIRLPQGLQREAGGCSCDWCKAHPKEVPAWDTLVVNLAPPQDRHRPDTTWTVHAPDVRQLNDGMETYWRRKKQEQGT